MYIILRKTLILSVISLLLLLLQSITTIPAESVDTVSETLYDVTVQKNVLIPMRDGVRLAADIY